MSDIPNQIASTKLWKWLYFFPVHYLTPGTPEFAIRLESLPQICATSCQLSMMNHFSTRVKVLSSSSMKKTQPIAPPEESTK